MSYGNYVNFNYIFPGNKTILYYCSCVINRNIKRYLEKKKLNIINKLVHIFLEDSITNVIEKRKIERDTRQHKNKSNIKNTLFIGDRVHTEVGSGVIQDIRADNITVIKIDSILQNGIVAYYNKDQITLLQDDKEIVEILLESSEDYSDDFIEESNDSNELNESDESKSLFTYIKDSIYNLKVFFFG